jgi:hypothetical protein
MPSKITILNWKHLRNMSAVYCKTLIELCQANNIIEKPTEKNISLTR